MAESQEPAFLIAAGGTAGHVLPALAVADALRARGARVTFAGSPDRAEARLVPDAGYELDTFRVSGLPRQPGLAQARAALHALAAPAACDRILARRQPQAVLGGGGYVAGPMVVAAARRRLPTAITEADAHLGLANRLAAPFAKRVFLSFPIAGREPPKYEVVGRPLPAAALALPRAEARQQLGLPPDGPVLLVAGARAGAQALNEFAVETFGTGGPAILHVSGERDYEALRARVTRPDYVLVPVLEGLGAAYGAADLALMRSGSTVWELAAAGVPGALLRGGRRRDRRARDGARQGGRHRALAARRPGAPGRDGRGDEARREAGRRRDDRRGADGACSGSRVGASGSSGSAARG
jgi:UDP-N-acetylglucosamine--N-acetylmuramyl-(pentapeptide) pyrophosphoryl-undecaprenol N-acetylglucosamine transferase